MHFATPGLNPGLQNAAINIFTMCAQYLPGDTVKSTKGFHNLNHLQAVAPFRSPGFKPGAAKNDERYG